MTSGSTERDFSIIRLENTVTIALPHRLSAVEAVAFSQTVTQVLSTAKPPQTVILDCRQTTFIDSSGVGSLVLSLKTTQQQGIELVLQEVGPQFMAVLEMTDLRSMMNIVPLVCSPQSPNPQCTNPPRDPKVLPPLPTTHPSVKSKVKRLMDIVGALVGLGLLAVLFVPIAIAIKLDSPGPIFFGQIRCGWMHKPFRIWKFRSMCVDAEARKSDVKNNIAGKKFFKNPNDPRITRIGRFLRRTSLDEFPQFWNVLRGEMSLVGTRPPTPDEVANYHLPEWQRLNVKPGITGEWQVRGRSRIKTFEEVVALDQQYQEKWSIGYDFYLILKTLVVIFHKNSGAV